MARKITLTVALVLAWLVTIVGLVCLWQLIPLGAFLWMGGMVLTGWAAMDALGDVWAWTPDEDLADEDLDGETV